MVEVTLLKGDVVLIKDDKPLPRYKWKIGKVEEVVVGRDGNTRGAKLLVSLPSQKSSTWFRPVQKLIPFEIVDDLQQQNQLLNDDDVSARDVAAVRERLPRRAAVEGTIIRRLGERYT